MHRGRMANRVRRNAPIMKSRISLYRDFDRAPQTLSYAGTSHRVATGVGDEWLLGRILYLLEPLS